MDGKNDFVTNSAWVTRLQSSCKFSFPGHTHIANLVDLGTYKGLARSMRLLYFPKLLLDEEVVLDAACRCYNQYMIAFAAVFSQPLATASSRLFGSVRCSWQYCLVAAS